MTGTKRVKWGLVVVAAVVVVAIGFWLSRTPVETPSPPVAQPEEPRVVEPAPPPFVEPAEPQSQEEPTVPEEPTLADLFKGLQSEMPALPVSNAERDPDFKKYKQLVDQLEAEAAAHRASSPVFTEFRETILDYAVPWMLQGEEARLALMAKEENDPEISERISEFDEKHARVIMRCLIYLHSEEFIEGASELVESGKLELNDEIAAMFPSTLGFLGRCREEYGDTLDEIGAYEDEVGAYENPYDEGTLEHEIFQARLGEAGGAMFFLGAPLWSLPLALERKKAQALELYDSLVAKYGKQNIHPKYSDEYIDSMVDEFKKAQELTKNHWDAQKLLRKLFGGIVDD